jgi:UDP-glucuronate decarboxylase
LEKAVQNKDIVAHKYLNGFPKLDLLYVDDLCRAVVCAIEHGAQGAFNIGTGVATSTTEVAQWIIKIVGSQSKARHLQIEGYTTNIVMDYSRASAILGWCPTIEVHRGLEALIKAAQLRRGKDAKG